MLFPLTLRRSRALSLSTHALGRVLLAYLSDKEALALVVMVLLVRSADVFYHFVDWDEASMMSQAWAMTRGEILYRDLPQIHGVLNMAIFVPFFLLFGTDTAPHAIKMLNLALVLVEALLVRGIARRWLGNQPSALLAAIVFAYTLGRPWAMSSHGEFYTIVPTLGAVGFLFFPLPRMRLPFRMFTAGMLLSTAFFIKQVAAFDAAALLLAWLVVAPGDHRTKVQALGWFLLGGLVILAAIAAYFFVRGAVIEWVDSMFLRGLRYSRVTGGPRPSLVLQFVRAVAIELAPAALSLAAGVAFVLLSDSHQSAETRFFLVLLAWLVGSMTAILLTGRFYDHYLLQLIPAVSLAAVYIVSRMPPVLCRAFVVGTVTLLFAYAAISAGLQFRSLHAAAWVPPAVQASRALANAVRSYTRDHDRIFMYETSNLDVFYLSRRLPAAGITMFIDMAEEHTGDVEISAAKRQSLAERPPALILVGTVGTQGFRLPVSEAFFRTLLRRHYERVSDVQNVAIYRRR